MAKTKRSLTNLKKWLTLESASQLLNELLEGKATTNDVLEFIIDGLPIYWNAINALAIEVEETLTFCLIKADYDEFQTTSKLPAELQAINEQELANIKRKYILHPLEQMSMHIELTDEAKQRSDRKKHESFKSFASSGYKELGENFKFDHPIEITRNNGFFFTNLKAMTNKSDKEWTTTDSYFFESEDNKTIQPLQKVRIKGREPNIIPFGDMIQLHELRVSRKELIAFINNFEDEEEQPQDQTKSRLSESTLLESLGLMAILLAKSSNTFKYGTKPNAKQIKEKIEQLAAKHGIELEQVTNLNQDISTSLKLLESKGISIKNLVEN